MSLIKQIDAAHMGDGFPSRVDLFLDIRDAVKRGEADSKLLKIIEKHKTNLKNKRDRY